MNKSEKILLKILSGNSDNNIFFSDLVNILVSLSFDMRIRGSHHIFSKQNFDEIINIQSKNGYAKPYQVKQVREIISKYGLKI